MFEFSIHGNSQRLKHTSRGFLTSVLLKPSWYSGLDGLREIARRCEWRTPSPLDNDRRDLATKSFFSVITKHVCERAFIGSIHELSHRLAAAHVETHIKWCVDRVPEAALRICELIGRQT